MRARIALWLLPICCACHGAAPTAGQVPPHLERYADACAFVPDGLVSHGFVDLARVPVPDGPSRGLVVIAGADFEKPIEFGFGRFRGVAVHDVGRIGNLKELLLPEEDALVPAEPCDGWPVWFLAPADRPCRDGERWLTTVDDRFVVRASSRGMLEFALRRAGTIERILAPFQPMPAAEDGVVGTILTLPRDPAREPDAARYGAGVPDQSLVHLLMRTQLRIYSRDPLGVKYAEGFFPDRDEISATRAGVWLCHTHSLADPAPNGEPGWLLIYMVLFGMKVAF